MPEQEHGSQTPRSTVAQGIASPLTLLHEEQAAEEVLSLSYTLNLGFWERYALSVARGLGARVTVVADAGMASADVGYVHHAGITYLDGRAVCKAGGAFHPKLLLIAGKNYATVAIGSGNVTLPGWHGNAEIWTVLRGDDSGAPTTFIQLAAWLRGLPVQVDFSAGLAGPKGALARVADRLDRLPATEPGPTIASSLESPIIEQLPAKAVEELILYAPYHGPKTATLAAVMRRLSPQRLRVLLQPGQTIVDGSALADFLAPIGGAAESIREDRFCHGKLVEWAENSQRYALVGSPNLTAAALERSMAEGGNCELALLSEVEKSLAPETGELPHDSLIDLAYEPERLEAPQAGLILLGATLANGGVELILHRPLTEPASLEAADEELWERVSDLPTGQITIQVGLPIQAGSAVRLVAASGLVSNICFVADPSRVLRTRMAHVGRSETDEGGVFQDPKIADALAGDLAALRPFLRTVRRAPGGQSGSNGASGVQEYRSWEEYLDLCSAHIGERLLAYGLSLPWLDLDPSQQPLDDEAGFGDFEDESPDDVPEDPEGEGPDGIPPLDARNRPDKERRRYQRWCSRISELSSGLPPAARLVILRLLLRAVAGRLYDGPEQWVPTLAHATQALAAPGEVFPEEAPQLGSLAAVSLAVMRGSIQDYASGPESRLPYDDAARAVTTLLEYRTPELIESYAGELIPYFGASVATSTINGLVEALLTPDPIDDAVYTIGVDLHLEADRDGYVIHLVDTLRGDPRMTVLRVLGLVRGGPIAVEADTPDGGRIIGVWRSPDLVLVRQSNLAGIRGSHYIMRGWGPDVYWKDIDSLPTPAAQWASAVAMPSNVRKLWDELGL